MASTYRILVFGASYGALLGAKLLAGGHAVTLVCRTETAALIDREGIRVRIPGPAQEDVEIDSRSLPGRLVACTPSAVDASDYDLVVLAMQEPQYQAPDLRAALTGVARSSVPCMSIMNMPPLPYLARIAGVPVGSLRAAYADVSVWDSFDPALMTLCSPDPQAFRPVRDQPNLLQVRLATNFKTAPFERDDHTAMLSDLAADIEAARFPHGDDRVALPVKLKVHASLFVPLAKWGMLLTGNYRCVEPQGMRSISAAVHDDPALARSVYEWTAGVCRKLGARDEDLVPFAKYAAAATALTAPSSAARALAGGAQHIERVDRLVQAIAAGLGMQLDELDRTVGIVDGWLASNRGRQRDADTRTEAAFA